MNFSIQTEYSGWFLILCIVISASLSFLLYWKNKDLNENPPYRIWILAILRFFSLLIITFLLLSPLIKSITKTIEKPIIIIAQDNSESILTNEKINDSLKEFHKGLNSLIDKLSDDYQVHTFSFGDKTKKDLLFNFTDKYTDFSEFFDYINTNYYNRNIGAIVLASDGIYNRGANPVFINQSTKVPVYSVAIGDTGKYKDIALSQIKHNQIAFTKSKFPVQVFLQMNQLKGEETQMNVIWKNKIIFTKKIKSTGDDYSETVNFEVETNETGVQKYTVELIPLKIEKNTRNNSKTFVVEVINNKKKILLLGNSPHPDIAAIKQALQENENYTVESFMANEFTKQVSDYDIIILHQLPSKNNNIAQIITSINKYKLPTLFILGNQSNIPAFNTLRTGFTVNQSKLQTDEAQGVKNDAFTFFELSLDYNLLQFAPPLVVPFGDYQTSAGYQTMAFQKINQIETKRPLISISSENLSGYKCAVIAGEGLWKWRLFDYSHTQTHTHFNQIIGKIIQFLSIEIKKEKFVVNYKKIVNENEPLFFTAQIYNESYELVNNENVEMAIFDSIGKEFNYTFDKSDKMYSLTCGTFPVGEYSFTAKTRINNVVYEKKQKFSIMPVNIEKENTTANYQLLYALSKQSKGKMYVKEQINEIYNQIKNNEDIVPVSYSESSLKDLINYRWLFLVLLLLLGSEWFLRKYWGSY